MVHSPLAGKYLKNACLKFKVQSLLEYCQRLPDPTIAQTLIRELNVPREVYGFFFSVS